MNESKEELALLCWKEQELNFAILDDNVTYIEKLISEGCFFFPSHLRIAAQCGSVNAVDYLIQKGLDKKLALKFGTEEVIKAIQTKDNYKKLHMSLMVKNKIKEFRDFINENQPEIIPQPKRLKI